MADWIELDLSQAELPGGYGVYENGVIRSASTGWPDIRFPDIVLDPNTYYLVEADFDISRSTKTGLVVYTQAGPTDVDYNDSWWWQLERDLPTIPTQVVAKISGRMGPGLWAWQNMVRYDEPYIVFETPPGSYLTGLRYAVEATIDPPGVAKSVNPWSDALYVPEAEFPDGDTPTVWETYCVDLKPLVGDRCLVTYMESRYTQTNGSLDWDGQHRLSCRVVSAPLDDVSAPEGGPITEIYSLESWRDWFLEHGLSNGPYIDTTLAVERVSEDRYLFLGQAYGDGTGGDLTVMAFALLAVDGNEVTVLDRKDLRLARYLDGWAYNGYAARLAALGDSERVVAFFNKRPYEGNSQGERMVYHVIDCRNDQIVIGPERESPDKDFPSLAAGHNAQCGVYANAEVGVVLQFGRNQDVAKSYVIPFTVNADFTLTFSPATVVEGWTGRAEVLGRPFNDGQITPIPGTSRFIASTNDDFNWNEYVRVSVLETDGARVWVVDQALGYCEDAGYGGTANRWVPTTLTPNGKVVGLYSNAWEGADPRIGQGSHGHLHTRPVLLYDMLGKTVYEEVGEAELPTTGMWGRFYDRLDYTGRAVAATESGIFGAVSGSTDVVEASMIGWVPVTKLLRGGPTTARRAFKGARR